MRRHRERRQMGLRFLGIELREREIEARAKYVEEDHARRAEAMKGKKS
jgi:hypothetical protein